MAVPLNYTLQCTKRSLHYPKTVSCTLLMTTKETLPPPSMKVNLSHFYHNPSIRVSIVETRLNPRLTKTMEEFREIMENLNLHYPKQIDNAVPKNLLCGIF